MFANLSEVWIVAVILIIVTIATGRWIIAKITGKELVPGDLNILANLREKIVNNLLDNIDLITLEKEKGRKAVKKEIENKINEYIQNADIFTENEKELLTMLDKQKLISLIENELVKRGILKN